MTCTCGAVISRTLSPHAGVNSGLLNSGLPMVFIATIDWTYAINWRKRQLQKAEEHGRSAAL